MRVAEGMHVEWVGHEAVVLDEKRGNLHHLSPSAALVYALILEHGFDAGLDKLRTAYELPIEAESDVKVLLDDLLAKGLLVDG